MAKKSELIITLVVIAVFVLRALKAAWDRQAGQSRRAPGPGEDWEKDWADWEAPASTPAPTPKQTAASTPAPAPYSTVRNVPAQFAPQAAAPASPSPHPAQSVPEAPSPAAPEMATEDLANAFMSHDANRGRVPDVSRWGTRSVRFRGKADLRRAIILREALDRPRALDL